MSMHHEWLALVEISGPFLAVPVLKEAFPQGLEELDAAKRKRLRQAYDEWRDALEKAVFHSCRNKAEIVSSDEREQGMRALLNFGHTFGHAIEAGMGYGNWSHGEAVAAGSMMAIELSHMLGWLDKCDVERAEALFSRAGLPTFGPALGVHRYLELMQHDKKVQNGVLRLVLLEKLGSAVVSDRASLAEIERAINARVRCG